MATFDIFEALRDGSHVCRAAASDCAERDRKLQELAKTSNNTSLRLPTGMESTVRAPGTC
jgi:hypothetical protein